MEIDSMGFVRKNPVRVSAYIFESKDVFDTLLKLEHQYIIFNLALPTFFLDQGDPFIVHGIQPGLYDCLASCTRMQWNCSERLAVAPVMNESAPLDVHMCKETTEL